MLSSFLITKKRGDGAIIVNNDRFSIDGDTIVMIPLEIIGERFISRLRDSNDFIPI